MFKVKIFIRSKGQSIDIFLPPVEHNSRPLNLFGRSENYTG